MKLRSLSVCRALVVIIALSAFGMQATPAEAQKRANVLAVVIDYAALKTELQTDPNAYGYAPLIAAGNMQGLADKLNQVRANISIPRPDVAPEEVLEAIRATDLRAATTAVQSAYMQSLLVLPNLRILKGNGTDARVLTNLMDILTNGSASETRLRALATRTGSRAEQLFGPGAFLSWTDITTALAQ